MISSIKSTLMKSVSTVKYAPLNPAPETDVPLNPTGNIDVSLKSTHATDVLPQTLSVC